jgi:hypothetical protein
MKYRFVSPISLLYEEQSYSSCFVLFFFSNKFRFKAIASKYDWIFSRSRNKVVPGSRKWFRDFRHPVHFPRATFGARDVVSSSTFSKKIYKKDGNPNVERFIVGLLNGLSIFPIWQSWKRDIRFVNTCESHRQVCQQEEKARTSMVKGYSIDRSNFVNRSNYVELCVCLEPPNREFSFLCHKQFKVGRRLFFATFLSSAWELKTSSTTWLDSRRVSVPRKFVLRDFHSRLFLQTKKCVHVPLSSSSRTPRRFNIRCRIRSLRLEVF